MDSKDLEFIHDLLNSLTIVNGNLNRIKKSFEKSPNAVPGEIIQIYSDKAMRALDKAIDQVQECRKRLTD